MADAILACFFLIEHPIYIEWTVNLYACLCKLCMLPVAIFLEKIRKYSCFYFHLSSFFLESYFYVLLK